MGMTMGMGLVTVILAVLITASKAHSIRLCVLITAKPSLQLL